ncbi:MAG TPA: hypothetical protein DCG78_07725, partial [Anaerolineaceae bacterium]|nr:hypothetical protein [Anaerolineaceae bacterium]
METSSSTQAPQFADVSINLAHIDRSYHYAIPEELQGKLQPGCLVVVPFGKQVVQGVVLAFIDQPEVPHVLEIQELISEETVLTPAQLALAEWLARETFAPLGACVSLMIPNGLSQRADQLISLVRDFDEPPAEMPPLQKRILKLLKARGSLRGGQIERALPKLEWRRSLDTLRKNGWLKTKSILPPARISPKTVRTAQLSIPPKAVAALDAQALSRRTETGERRLKVLQLLAQEAFPVDFSWIYA